MPTITIKTQAELDALPDSFKEFTYIHIVGGTPFDRIQVSKNPGSSHVEAWGSSHVVAWGSSHVEARESSHVEARGSSHVEARESSHVVAWGSSHVEAWGSSHVEARGNTAVHNHDTGTTIELFAFAAAWLIAKAKKLTRNGDNTTVITPKPSKGLDGWLENNAVSPKDGKVILFKRVSKEFKTQEHTENETLWAVGSTVDHPNWAPKSEECGEGKFHACSRAYLCDEFRSTDGDLYVAIEIAVADLYAWPEPSYPHKIAFRRGTVLHQCSKFGMAVAAAEAVS